MFIGTNTNRGKGGNIANLAIFPRFLKADIND
jgi:hypothetical protein